MHNLEHHLVKAGYEIVIPDEQLMELCEEAEMASTQTLLASTQMTKRPAEVNIRVLSSEGDNDSKWRTVLASLYQHGRVMGAILIKHIYESLLARLLEEQSIVQVPMQPGLWEFPQLRQQESHTT